MGIIDSPSKPFALILFFLQGFLSDHSSKLVGDGGIYKTIRSEVRRAVYEVRDDLQNVSG